MKATPISGLALLHIALVLSACTHTSRAPLPAQASASSTSTVPEGKEFSRDELEQLVALIALYPDALLAQILMASTCPLEVVAADR